MKKKITGFLFSTIAPILPWWEMKVESPLKVVKPDPVMINSDKALPVELEDKVLGALNYDLNKITDGLAALQLPTKPSDAAVLALENMTTCIAEYAAMRAMHPEVAVDLPNETVTNARIFSMMETVIVTHPKDVKVNPAHFMIGVHANPNVSMFVKKYPGSFALKQINHLVTGSMPEYVANHKGLSDDKQFYVGASINGHTPFGTLEEEGSSFKEKILIETFEGNGAEMQKYIKEHDFVDGKAYNAFRNEMLAALIPSAKMEPAKTQIAILRRAM